MNSNSYEKPIQRIKKILDFYKMPVTAFERKIDVGANVIGSAIKRNAPLKDYIIMRSYELFPDINRDWLFFCEGEMLRNSETSLKESNQMKIEKARVVQQQNYTGETETLVASKCRDKERIIAEKDKRIELLESLLELYKVRVETELGGQKSGMKKVEYA